MEKTFIETMYDSNLKKIFEVLEESESIDSLSIRANYLIFQRDQLKSSPVFNIEQRHIKFLDDEITKIQDELKMNHTNNFAPEWNSGIKWNSDLGKTGLVELIYALLDSESIKGGRIKEIVKAFEQFFDLDLQDHDSLLQNIKNRRGGNECTLLDQMKKSFLHKRFKLKDS